jgi:hypothetical protein
MAIAWYGVSDTNTTEITMQYTVRTRYGWGWEVEGANWRSHPFELASDAQALADHLNAGDSVETAIKRIRAFTDFRGGRFYAR